MKNKRNKKIYKDKKGRDYIKEAYFVGGKMKFNKVYVIDGIPADEFYERNATSLDFFANGDYELMSSGEDDDSHCNEQSKQESDLTDNERDLPF